MKYLSSLHSVCKSPDIEYSLRKTSSFSLHFFAYAKYKSICAHSWMNYVRPICGTATSTGCTMARIAPGLQYHAT